ncbi:MAG: hypothetical protein M0Z46_02020 [Actinomycetota bacterium]|jgi:hypothetical protein|nr:hypothetical protein [Actinomycetota bacterium]
MSDPARLEERLRAAMGADGPLGPARGGRGSGPAGAKARVLAGIRRRRLRKLEGLGAAVVVAIGLAIGLPQVLAGSPALPTQGRAASGVAQSAGPAAGHGAFAPVRTPARRVATCRLHGGKTTACGKLETGAGARRLAMAADAANAPMGIVTAAPAARALGSPLIVREGAALLVTLPRLTADWRWGSPSIAGTYVYHGSGPPVVVREVRAPRGLQRFLVRGKDPLTVVLLAREDASSGRGTPPSIGTGTPGTTGTTRTAGTSPVWVLELKVVGR